MEQVFPLFSPQAEKNVDIKILHLQITFDCFFRSQSPGTLWEKYQIRCQRSHSLAVRVVACRVIGPAFGTSSPQRILLQYKMVGKNIEPADLKIFTVSSLR